MGRAQFEYDEHGSTFYYFLIAFYAIILIPLTYYLWPRKQKKEKESHLFECRCEGCLRKEISKQNLRPWQNVKRRAIKFIIILGWVGFVLLAYKVASIRIEHNEWDPYAVLELDQGAPMEKIKRKYRKLSMVHHPDRGGDPKRFVAISKAYQALTDDEARENWEKYGNPDGPGAMTFGIALPKWIVSKEYGVWVLLVYGLFFLIILPSAVGMWWYNSVKYGTEQVLLTTSRFYGSMMYRSPSLMLRRLLMILGASFEFWKFYNPQVIERESDEKEVPLLIKDLHNLGEKNKERPLSFPYSIKARAIIHAHLERLRLPENTLEKDRQMILKKCPLLIQELVNVFIQLTMFANTGRLPRSPSLESLENILKMAPMLVQAVWNTRNANLLQLPHFTEQMSRQCITRKRPVRNCQDIAAMSNEDRTVLLERIATESQAFDICSVLASMPKLDIEWRVEVPGEDEDKKAYITAGSFVTLFVTLKRERLMEYNPSANNRFNYPSTLSKFGHQPKTNAKDNEEENDTQGDEPEDTEEPVGQGEKQAVTAKARKPWEKQAKKKKGAAAKQNKKKQQNNKKKPPVVPAAAAAVDNAVKTAATTEDEKETKDSPKKKTKEKEPREDDYSGSSADESVSESEIEEVQDALDENREQEVGEDDDEFFDQDLIKRNMILETKSKITHPVHCPYFPEDKFEWWWVFFCSRKDKRLIAGPIQVTTLTTEEEVELKFSAPQKQGVHTFQICVRSDSYIDMDLNRDVKLTVHEAVKQDNITHPQWNFNTDDEADKKSKGDSEGSDASEYTEDEDDD